MVLRHHSPYLVGNTCHTLSPLYLRSCSWCKQKKLFRRETTTTTTMIENKPDTLSDLLYGANPDTLYHYYDLPSYRTMSLPDSLWHRIEPDIPEEVPFIDLTLEDNQENQVEVVDLTQMSDDESDIEVVPAMEQVRRRLFYSDTEEEESEEDDAREIEINI